MATSIAGSSVPEPTEYSEDYSWRGGSILMADGTVKFQSVATNAKRAPTLTWTGITNANKNIIRDAINSFQDGTAAFVSPGGDTFTVTRVEGGGGFSANAWNSLGSVVWDVTVSFREY